MRRPTVIIGALIAALSGWSGGHCAEPSGPLPRDSEAASPSELLPPTEYVALRQAEPLALPPVEPHGLTLAEVESLALAYNPTLAQGAALVRAARGEQYQAGLPPNPTIGYVGGEIGNDGQGGQNGLLVGQDFIRGNKLQLSQAVAAREAQRREQRLAAQQRRVLTDVRIAYYDAYLAQRRLELANSLQTIGRQAVATAQALIEAQEGRRTDVLQAEIEGQRAGMDLAQAESNVRGTWRRLAALVGQPELPLQTLAADVDSLRWAGTWETTLAELVQCSPEVLEAQAEVARARAALARACAEPIPDISTQASVQYDDGTEDTIAGAQISLPLPLWNRNQGGIAQAQAELTAARRRAEAVELRLRHALALEFQQYETALARVNTIQGEVLNRAEQNLRLATEGYQAGELAFLDFLTVQRTYFQVNLEYLVALGELNESVQKLHGLLLADSYNGLTE